MSEHYYTRSPEAGHDRREIETRLRGMSFRFVTDAGVFSKTGVDYGSRTLIENIELSPNAAVLDVGCGYGPIGLAAAKMVPDGLVTMVDVNERAVELARENAKRNGIANVAILQSDLYEKLEGRRFDAILTNPPIRAGKAVVHRIFEEAAEHLCNGGKLWVVIQKKQGAPSAMTKLESLFDAVKETAKDKGYRILCAVKAGPVG